MKSIRLLHEYFLLNIQLGDLRNTFKSFYASLRIRDFDFCTSHVLIVKTNFLVPCKWILGDIVMLGQSPDPVLTSSIDTSHLLICSLGFFVRVFLSLLVQYGV